MARLEDATIVEVIVRAEPSLTTVVIGGKVGDEHVIEKTEYETSDYLSIMAQEVAARLMRAGFRPTAEWVVCDRDPGGQWVDWSRGYSRRAQHLRWI